MLGWINLWHHPGPLSKAPCSPALPVPPGRGSWPQSIPHCRDGPPWAHIHHPCSRVRPVLPRSASSGQPGLLLSLRGGWRAAVHRRTQPPEPLAWQKSGEQHGQIIAPAVSTVERQRQGYRPAAHRHMRCFCASFLEK